jgi:hypothetical protein
MQQEMVASAEVGFGHASLSLQVARDLALLAWSLAKCCP